jgi:hypothetical protein
MSIDLVLKNHTKFFKVALFMLSEEQELTDQFLIHLTTELKAITEREWL